mgnify:CR=1 FL=1
MDLDLRNKSALVCGASQGLGFAIAEALAHEGCRVGLLARNGAKLEGQPDWRQRDAQGRLPAPPHDASGHTWHHPDETLVRITKFGVAKAANLASYESSMPAYEGVLSDAEIVAALSWIKSQWPASIRVKHDEMNRSSSQQR